jgi:hypothetical protein
MFDEDFLGYGMYCHPLRLIEGQQAFGKANAQPGNRSLALSLLRPIGSKFGIDMIGVPGVTRTPDPQIRKLLLYPAELRGQARTGGRGV